jgi:hypothetical protein
MYGYWYYGGPSYMTFNFDKTISGKFNTAGVPTMGAWIARGAAAGTQDPPNIGIPPEIIGTIMNELNAASTKTIDCWCPMPNASLLSMDPDYSSGENYVTNFTNLLLNGSGGSYPGLNPAIKLFVENSNETWAGTPPNTQYYAFRGMFRYPGTNIGSVNSYSTLRSQIMVRDMKAAFPNHPRIKYVMGGQGALGYTGSNVVRTEGDSFTLNDVLNPSHIKPMTEHDYFAIAAYIDPASTATLAANAATWVSHIGNLAAQEADCAVFVNNQMRDGAGEQIAKYIGTLPGYKAGIYVPFGGKQLIGYEGGWNYSIAKTYSSIATVTSGSNVITNINDGGTPTTINGYAVGPGISDGLTTLRKVTASAPGQCTFSGGTASISGNIWLEIYPETALFLRACKRSQAWADAYISWFNAHNSDPAYAMPADFVLLDDRWGHCVPDAYDVQFTSTTGYANMDKAWLAIAARNAGLS